MRWITSTTSSGCSPFPPKSTARARCTGTRSATARRSPTSSDQRSTGEPDNVTKRMVYRIAADGAIQDQFEVTLQTGSPDERTKRAVQMQSLSRLPAPAFLFVVEPLFLMSVDQTQSYPAAVSAMLRSSWPSFLAVCRSGVGPGRDRLATESRVRPPEARAGRLGGLCAPLRVSRLLWASCSIVAGRSDSPVRIATLRLPATVPPARSAEHASRILSLKGIEIFA